MKHILFTLVLALCICSELHTAQDLLASTPNLSLEEAMLLLAVHGYDVSGDGVAVLDGQAVDIRTMLGARR